MDGHGKANAYSPPEKVQPSLAPHPPRQPRPAPVAKPEPALQPAPAPAAPLSLEALIHTPATASTGRGANAADGYTPLGLRLVRQLFAHFDADSDGHLSKPELRAFALATEGTEYDDDTLEELLRSFHSGSRGLTLSGFLALYRETELMDLARDARSLGLG